MGVHFLLRCSPIFQDRSRWSSHWIRDTIHYQLRVPCRVAVCPNVTWSSERSAKLRCCLQVSQAIARSIVFSRRSSAMQINSDLYENHSRGRINAKIWQFVVGALWIVSPKYNVLVGGYDDSGNDMAILALNEEHWKRSSYTTDRLTKPSFKDTCIRPLDTGFVCRCSKESFPHPALRYLARRAHWRGAVELNIIPDPFQTTITSSRTLQYMACIWRHRTMQVVISSWSSRENQIQRCKSRAAKNARSAWRPPQYQHIWLNFKACIFINICR